MRTNNGCKLPCWWGIVPGKTPFSEFVQLFERLSGIIEPSGFSYGNTDDDRYIVFLHNPGTDDSFGAHIGVTDGVVSSLRLDADITRLINSIDQILSEYGDPSQVLIQESEYPSEEEREDWFYHHYDVVLIYEDHYFLAWYSFGALRFIEPYYACVGISRPYFEIWSPGMVRDLDWIQNNVNRWNNKPYFPIDEVSTIKPETFKDNLFMVDDDRCFELDYAAIRSGTLGISIEDLLPTPTLDSTKIPYYMDGVYDIDN